MRNSYNWTWNVPRNNKNVKNEKCTMQYLEYGDKSKKKWKIRPGLWRDKG